MATGWEWERLPAGGPDLTEEVENLDQRVSDLEDAPGGGGASELLPTSLYPTGVGDVLGDYTTGGKYLVVQAASITGIRFRRYTHAGTLNLKLWVNGSAVATKSVTITGSGLHSVLFDSPVSVNANTICYVTSHEPGGGSSRYARCNAPAWETDQAIPVPLPIGVKMLLLHPGVYKAGEGQPDSASAVERFPVDPIYT